MENLIGFLIFVAIAAFSSYMQNLKQRKEEAEKKAEQAKRQARRGAARPEDLPEATRRMLYGDGGDIPTAVPRGEAPRQDPPPRPADRQRPIPVQPAAPQGDAPRHMPTPPMRQAPPEPPRRPQPGMDPRRREPTVQPARPRALVPPQPVRQQARRRTEQAWQQAHGQDPRAAAPPPPAPRPKAPVPAQAVQTRAVSGARIRRMARNPQTLREALVLSELLQPPVSMRPHGGGLPY
jgi:hypothetical protein